jgi:hypothetical protein
MDQYRIGTSVVCSLEFYQQQLALVEEIVDRRGQGNALFNMSLALAQLNRGEDAIRYAEEALKILEQVESPYCEMVRTQLAAWRPEQYAPLTKRTLSFTASTGHSIQRPSSSRHACL